MDQLTFNDLRWCIEEADYRTLERFCKRTQDPKLNPNKIRRWIEAYVLELFDNVARCFLTRVKDFRDIEHYAATLRSWCDDILPGLERQFRPEVDEAILLRFEERFGTDRIDGSVDRGKLARRIAHWRGGGDQSGPETLGRSIRKNYCATPKTTRGRACRLR